MHKTPRILFFINGSNPTLEQRAEALKYGTSVAFRNARFVGSDEKPEACDGVIGEVPKNYKGVPSAEKAFEKFEKDVKAAIDAQNKAAEAAKKAAKAQAKADEDADKAKAEAAEKAKKDADEAVKKTGWTAPTA